MAKKRYRPSISKPSARLGSNFPAQMSGPSIADQMGPGFPPNPSPLDSSRLPRQFQFRPGWNLPSQPGEGRLDFAILRTLADSYDILRKAIEVRKDEVATLAWDIVPRAPSARAKRELLLNNREKIQRARQFFRSPDRHHSFQEWMRSILEEVLVLDALSIYKRRTWGGNLYSLDVIDGSTIKPLLTLQGRIPDAPDTAYQQWLYGMARTDFSTEELIYKPKNARVHTPYGFSNVEQFAVHINLGLRWQIWNTRLFTDGNVPSMILSAPETWTPDQIEEFQELWDTLIAGDAMQQRRLKWVPNGVRMVTDQGSTGDVLKYSKDFADYLINITCIAMDVTRQEIGLEPGHESALGGSAYATEMRAVQFRRSIYPLCGWLSETVFNPILWDEFGLEDFSWTWPDLNSQDPKDQAETNKIMLFSAQKSLDDILLEQGKDPLGVGLMLVEGEKFYTEVDLIRLSREGTLAVQQQENLLSPHVLAHLDTLSPKIQQAVQDASQGATPGTTSPAAVRDMSITPVEDSEAQDSLDRDTTSPMTASGTSGNGMGNLKSAGLADYSPVPTAAAIKENYKAAFKKDITNWQKKSMRAYFAGDSPQVRFASEVLPEKMVSDIYHKLEKVCTHDEIKRVFDPYWVK